VIVSCKLCGVQQVDYFERAKRLEEIPLMQKYYEEEKQLMKQVWEQQEQERVSIIVIILTLGTPFSREPKN